MRLGSIWGVIGSKGELLDFTPKKQNKTITIQNDITLGGNFSR